jgi:hypothetical protein
MRASLGLTMILVNALTACDHLGAHRAEPVSAASMAPPTGVTEPTAPVPAPAATAVTATPEEADPIPAAPQVAVSAGGHTPRAAKPASPARAKDKPQPAAAPVTPTPAVPAAVAASTPPAAPQPKLDFKAMEQRLRDTPAIGLFTKLSIKNQVDALLQDFRAFHAGRTPPTLDDLHQRYDGLLLKVVTLVQNDDAELASSISASRSAIWEKLSNRESFQTL